MQLFVPIQQKAKKLNKEKSLPTNVQVKSESFFVATWKSYTRLTSIHSVHYLTETSISLMEKLLWAIAILSAFATMVYCCILLSNRFKTSLISTVFESTNYKVSEVPFPAVHLCNQNRLNYNKTDEAVEKFFPSRSKNDTKTFVTFLRILQNMDYGSYDEFEVIRKENVTDINKLNLTEVYIFMMLDCEDFFVSCSWRKVEFNCCNWISRQITEYGVCWSFNSATNVGSKHVDRSLNFPWRVPNHGPKTGLRVVMNTHPETKISRGNITNTSPGVVAMVQHPSEWPRDTHYFGAGSSSALRIKPTVFSTSEDVRGLDPEERQCNYDSESQRKNLTYIKGLPYMRSNCMTECRQVHMMSFCGCSVAFHMPADNYPECDLSGLFCLIDYNEILNAEKPQKKNEFFDQNEDGIMCNCLPECSRIVYDLEINPIYDEKPIYKDFVMLDIFYASRNMIKYRTDRTFSFMDLIVGFGGIVSLFLGVSVLSGAEIIYFSTIALFWHRKRSRIIRQAYSDKIKAKFPFVH